MALRISGSKCRVTLTSAREGSDDVSHMFCDSRLHGVPCRLDGLPGKKAYVLCIECLQPVGGHKTHGGVDFRKTKT
jgi:hypothetical protein